MNLHNPQLLRQIAKVELPVMASGDFTQGVCDDMTKSETTKKPRVDGQITGLAGELFVAAELLKRGLQTSVTFGNAKAIDLLAYNQESKRYFTVQVKALRKKNYFPIKPNATQKEHIYVFVLLNEPGVPVEYFVVPGSVLVDEQERFGKDFQHPTFPGIHPKSLRDFNGAWHYFTDGDS